MGYLLKGRTLADSPSPASSVRFSPALISAAISTGLLALVYQGIGMVIENAQSVFRFIPFIEVLPYVAAAFVLFGLFVGFCGGFISIRKYLKMEGNEILGW